MAVLTKITSRSLADNAVSSAKIQDGAIAVADVADGSISTLKLADDAVTAAKLASNAVVDASIASGAAIASSKLADDPLSGTNASAVAGTYTAEQQRVHGSTFTTTGSTITGDVVFESLTDQEVIFSGTGTITGSGGKMTMKGLESPVAENDTINTTYINAGGISAGDLNWNSVTKGTLNDNVTYPDGHIVQVRRKFISAAYDEGDLRGHKRKIPAHGAMWVEITPKYDNSSIFIHARWTGGVSNSWNVVGGIEKNGWKLSYSGAGGPQEGTVGVAATYDVGAGNTGFLKTVAVTTIDAGHGTNPGVGIAGQPIRYAMYLQGENAAYEFHTNLAGAGSTDETGSSEIIAMEIMGIVG